MYEYLKGEVIQKNPTSLLLEVNGIGYLLQISLQTYENIPSKGFLQIYTYYHLRPELVKLYGFSSLAEREMFLMLNSVSGIGPTTAITILSYSALSQLKDAIQAEDLHILTQIKGIGQKTAQRVIVELKDKMQDFVPSADKILSPIERDAVMALTSLGLNRGMVEKTVKQILQTGDFPLNEIIRKALKIVGK
ncbi:MAG: Holliday junction branch migration protein RuvA [Planctomycetota bacterium]